MSSKEYPQASPFSLLPLQTKNSYLFITYPLPWSSLVMVVWRQARHGALGCLAWPGAAWWEHYHCLASVIDAFEKPSRGSSMRSWTVLSTLRWRRNCQDPRYAEYIVSWIILMIYMYFISCVLGKYNTNIIVCLDYWVYGSDSLHFRYMGCKWTSPTSPLRNLLPLWTMDCQEMMELWLLTRTKQGLLQ